MTRASDTVVVVLRPSEVAKALGIGRTKTYALISDGTIPSIRIGGSVRVPVDALEDWIRTRTSSSSVVTVLPTESED